MKKAYRELLKLTISSLDDPHLANSLLQKTKEFLRGLEWNEEQKVQEIRAIVIGLEEFRRNQNEVALEKIVRVVFDQNSFGFLVISPNGNDFSNSKERFNESNERTKYQKPLPLDPKLALAQNALVHHIIAKTIKKIQRNKKKERIILNLAEYFDSSKHWSIFLLCFFVKSSLFSNRNRPKYPFPCLFYHQDPRVQRSFWKFGLVSSLSGSLRSSFWRKSVNCLSFIWIVSRF